MVTWDLATGQEISRIPAPARLMGMALVNEGQNLVAASETGEVIVWNMDGSVKFTFQTVTNSAVAFSPDGKLLALGGYNGEVTLWDLQTGKASDVTLAGPAELDPRPGFLARQPAAGSLRLGRVDLHLGCQPAACRHNLSFSTATNER